MNNPLRYTDPSGEFWFFAAAALSAYIYAGAATGEANPLKWNMQNLLGAFSGIGSGLATSYATGATNSYIDNYNNKPALGASAIGPGFADVNVFSGVNGLTGAAEGDLITKYNITSDYSIYIRSLDFEKVAVKTNEVATSTAIITSGLEAAGRAAPYMSEMGKYAGNVSTIAQVVDHSYKFSKDEKNGGISGGRYSYRMTGTIASWGVATAISSWGVGGSFAGPFGVLGGIIVGVGFQTVEYSYDIIAPQIQTSYNHFFNALNSGSFVR